MLKTEKLSVCKVLKLNLQLINIHNCSNASRPPSPSTRVHLAFREGAIVKNPNSTKPYQKMENLGVCFPTYNIDFYIKLNFLFYQCRINELTNY